MRRSRRKQDSIAVDDVNISESQTVQINPKIANSYSEMIEDPTKSIVVLRHDPRPEVGQHTVFINAELYK